MKYSDKRFINIYYTVSNEGFTGTKYISCGTLFQLRSANVANLGGMCVISTASVCTTYFV